MIFDPGQDNVVVASTQLGLLCRWFESHHGKFIREDELDLLRPFGGKFQMFNIGP